MNWADVPPDRSGRLQLGPLITPLPEVDHRLVVVDDGRLQRECLAAQLTTHGLKVEAAWDLPSLLAAVETDEPVIILLRHGTGDAAHLLKASLHLGRSTKVVVFDLSVGRESEIIAAAESGAAGLHLHSESFEHLLRVIRTVSTGHAQCSQEVSAILLRRVYAFAGRSNPDAKTDMLTTREIDVLELIVEGLTNQQIASRLGLSLPTVKNHVHRLITKMGVASRAEAVTVYRADQYTNPFWGEPGQPGQSGSD